MGLCHYPKLGVTSDFSNNRPEGTERQTTTHTEGNGEVTLSQRNHLQRTRLVLSAGITSHWTSLQDQVQDSDLRDHILTRTAYAYLLACVKSSSI